MSSDDAFGPTETTDRLVLMDGLRGFALLGIFAVNLYGMGASSFAYGSSAMWTGPLDLFVARVTQFFAHGSFYFLFSLLFGAGFYMMMHGYGRRASGIGVPAYVRRLVLLGGLGIGHIYLLWWGDILLSYSIAGFLLLFFRKSAPRTLVIWTVALFALPVILFGLLPVLWEAADPASLGEWMEYYEESVRAYIAWQLEMYGSGSYGEIIQARLDEFSENLYGYFVYFPMVLGSMLLGVAFARNRLFSASSEHDEFYRKLLFWCLLPAIVGKMLYVLGIEGVSSYPGVGSLAMIGGTAMGGPALGLIYLCLLRAWFFRGGQTVIKAAMASAGRMALTNYLMQSFIAGLIFYSYGLGLYGQVPPVGLLMLAFSVFAGQLLLSRVWLRRCSIGPLEWLLRRGTYASRFTQ